MPTPLAGGQRKFICSTNDFLWPPARGVGKSALLSIRTVYEKEILPRLVYASPKVKPLQYWCPRAIAWGEQESKKLLYKEPTMESECIALAIGV